MTTDPPRSAIRHGFSWHRASGTRSVARATLPPGGFSFVSGDPAEYRSSPGVGRTFCGDRGNPPTYRSDGAHVDPTAASPGLQQGAPTHHVWLDDEIGWEADAVYVLSPRR